MTPSLHKLLFVTDAAINIAPTLEDKVDIVKNAIDLALALGITRPKVGILSAVEIVIPKIPSTLDAAILSKMAERGQIRGGDVDGPVAMDNALSLAAAKTKGLTSLVAGRADVLVVPNLEAGNILAKELTFAAQAEGAGLVLGAKVSMLLTRNDHPFSCSVAAPGLAVHWPKRHCARRPKGNGKMSRPIVTLNAGSSSIKFALFELDGGDPLALAVGLVEMAGNERRMNGQDRDGLPLHEDTWSDGTPFHTEALQRCWHGDLAVSQTPMSLRSATASCTMRRCS
jgi:hypothetical protein